MELPDVAMSLDDPPVAGLVLHEVPFQTPRLRPTICELVGCRLTMLALTAPRLAVVNECVNEPFWDSVPVNVSVNVRGVVGVVRDESVSFEHAPVARTATARRIARALSRYMKSFLA
jgi:hypothetical protein